MILIDVNGTISDLSGAKRNIFDEVTLRHFREWGFTGTPEKLKKLFAEVDEDLKYRIHSLKDYPKEVAKRLKLKVSDEKIHQENSNFQNKMIETSVISQETAEALKKLSKEVELVIFTNGWDQIVFPLLEKFEVLNCFADVVCIGGTGMNKEKGHVFPDLKKRGAWAMIGDKAHKDGLSEKFGIKFIDIGHGWDAAIKEIINLKRQRRK